MKPRPPSWAIAIAVRDSVTVSIGLDTSGIRRRIFALSAVETSQWTLEVTLDDDVDEDEGKEDDRGRDERDRPDE